MIPAAVAAAWGWQSAELAPVSGGLINTTYGVRVDGVPVAALQRMHPIFGAEVNLDLEAVTAHLTARGLETPRLLRTLDGRPWLDADGHVWRATTWVDGESIQAMPALPAGAAWAAAGGALVGRFHRAVADLAYDYKFVRAGVHDTAGHLSRLRECVDRTAPPFGGAADRGQAPGGGVVDDGVELGREILDVATALPPMPELPRRHVHGDLKVSNLVFRHAPVRGVALVDLDTLGTGTLAFELGDAMRSWCNPRGEDAGHVALELPLFAAAIHAFRAVADPITTDDERRSIAVGFETVCVELAARFAIDVFEDRYFGWDPSRFASRREHDLVRARGQLALARAVRAARADLFDIALG